jgi:feruloyl esterase
MTARTSLAVLLLSAVPALAQSPEPLAPPLPFVAAVKPCADLTKVDMEAIGGAGSRVVSAGEVDRNGVATCVVEGSMAPSIGFTALMPTRTWTGRYLQTGCGGLCGRTSLQVAAADGCVPVAAGGFAIASSDMGHAGMGGDFGRDPQKRVDFAYRAMHLTALAAKRLMREYYGRDARYAYFNGCSDGGREALVEAQRYPDDFDGIVAGAPALNFQVQNGLFHAWQARSNTGPDGMPILVAPRLPVLHAAVVAQCDALDGAKDGILADPRACHVDLASITCTAGQATGTTCLSAAEAKTARRFYDGPRDAASGARLTLGGPQPGSELSWAGVYVPASASQPIFSERITLDTLRHLSFPQNPPASFGLADVRFDAAWIERLRPLHALYDATNPDLSAFAAGGGKLILWHGWSDPHISPINTIAYHEAVGAQLGVEKRATFERLYLVPGMYHCGGGEGPSRLDLLTPLMAWVEQGVAPGAVAVKPAGGGPTTMLAPVTSPQPVPEWAGADFFAPYAAIER